MINHLRVIKNVNIWMDKHIEIKQYSKKYILFNVNILENKNKNVFWSTIAKFDVPKIYDRAHKSQKNSLKLPWYHLIKYKLNHSIIIIQTSVSTAILVDATQACKKVPPWKEWVNTCIHLLSKGYIKLFCLV